MAERTDTSLYFDGYKLGKTQKFFVIIAALTYAFDMMDLSLFNIVAPILQVNYGITNEHIATLNMLFFGGAVLGSIIGGQVSDKIGRKKALLISVSIFSIASLANAMWEPHHFALLELTRFFTGFGTFAAVGVCMSYISEMLPSEKRGKYQALIFGIGTFSIPLIAFTASAIATSSAEGWRIVFAIGGMMIVLVPFAMAFLVESPRWYITKGRAADAEAVMNKCLGIDNADMSVAYDNYQKSIAGYTKIGIVEQLKIMFSKKHRRQSLCAIALATGVAFGANFMSAYLNIFLVEEGFPLQPVLMIGAIAIFGQPLGEIGASFVSDKGGRTKPIVVYCLLACATFIALGLVNSVAAFGVAQFLRLFVVAGAQALMLTFIPESFPTSIRGSAVGFVYAFQRMCLIATPVLCLAAYNAFGWFGCTAINGLIFVVVAIVIGLFAKPTALKNIDAMHEE